MAFYPGYFSEWLTHNAGAPFNDSGAAQINEYTWNDKTSFATLVATSPQIEDVISVYYGQVIYPMATNYFENMPVGSIAYFPESPDGVDVPHESESQPWVPGCTLEFDTWAYDKGFDDVNATIGRGRLLSHKVRYRIEKKIAIADGYGAVYLAVTEVHSWGELIDLYDFNHDAGALARLGAIVQLGHGKGAHSPLRPAGKIFRTKILFDKKYGGLP